MYSYRPIVRSFFALCGGVTTTGVVLVAVLTVDCRGTTTEARRSVRRQFTAQTGDGGLGQSVSRGSGEKWILEIF